ncbi:MAG: glycosyltransferase, partial [Rhodocyclaceae bacterium]|nr:glycosyltransferase [Rhodocyclaceae bacterium]
PRVNGVSTSIETFRHTLAGQGVEVRVVAPRYGDEPDDPHVARVPGRPARRRSAAPPRAPRRPARRGCGGRSRWRWRRR